MVADVTYSTSKVKRTYTKHGHESEEEDRHRITMVTSDDRVAEAIETITGWSDDPQKIHLPTDVIVTPLATGSKDYIKWVKLQTIKHDDSTAFFNQDAGTAM